MITVSIVSHGQGRLVQSLLGDLARLGRSDLDIVVTLNIPEETPHPAGLAVRWRTNARPLGFGANHNHTLRDATSAFFCILNPDVRLPEDPFPALLQALQSPQVGLAAPRVATSTGKVENSARRFPTVLRLGSKALGLAPGLDYADTLSPASPDWVAGMFMLAKRDAFREVSGFDEGYFLYCEDIDLCRRLRRAGFDICLVPSARVIHDARRTSHRSLRYLRWHLASMCRYLTTRY